LSGLQPQQIPVDTSFAQQQLPQFIGTEGLIPNQAGQVGFRKLLDLVQKGADPSQALAPQPQFNFNQPLRGG
jgi:hypothetical protein